VLHDPERASPRVQAWSFLNYSRLGIRDFTAKVVIDLQDKMHRSAFGAGRFLTRGFYLMKPNTEKMDKARLAVRVSKAARDRILVTHKLTRTREFGDQMPLDGSVSLTQPTRVHFRL